MSRYTFLFFIFLGFCCFDSEADLLDSDYYSKSQTTYGGIGLIQNPTARFSADGEFTFGISAESPYNRLYAKMQFSFLGGKSIVCLAFQIFRFFLCFYQDEKIFPIRGIPVKKPPLEKTLYF